MERTRELGLYLVITIGNVPITEIITRNGQGISGSSMHRVMQKKHMYCMKYTMSLWHGDLHILLQRPIPGAVDMEIDVYG